MKKEDVDAREKAWLAKAGLGHIPVGELIGKTAAFYPDDAKEAGWQKLTFRIEGLLLKETALVLVPSSVIPYGRIQHFAFDAVGYKWYVYVLPRHPLAKDSKEDSESPDALADVLNKLVDILSTSQGYSILPGTFELLPPPNTTAS